MTDVKSEGRHCSWIGCKDLIAEGDFCKKHYRSWVQAGCPRTRADIEREKRIAEQPRIRELALELARKLLEITERAPKVLSALDRMCKVPDCGTTAVARGYCQKHWQKARSLNFPLDWTGEGYKFRALCQVPNCGHKHKSYGYCEPHYKAWKRDGRPDPWTPRLPPPRKEGIFKCSVRGCPNDAATNTLCKGHYARWQREDKPDLVTWSPPLIKSRGVKRFCKVPECGRDHHAHGYCQGHDLQWARLKRPIGWDPPPGPPRR